MNEKKFFGLISFASTWACGVIAGYCNNIWYSILLAAIALAINTIYVDKIYNLGKRTNNENRN